MLSEKPCSDKTCDVFATCNEGKGVGDYRRTCHQYQRYLGQQEGQSERDALRAEVEVLRRAMAFLAKQISSVHGACPADCDCDHYPDLSCKDSLSAWAISEARKEGEG